MLEYSRVVLSTCSGWNNRPSCDAQEEIFFSPFSFSFFACSCRATPAMSSCRRKISTNFSKRIFRDKCMIMKKEPGRISHVLTPCYFVFVSIWTVVCSQEFNSNNEVKHQKTR
eukprot:GHVT01009704.1.p3 GENE.GHVT01009704.1~~GHVT01009704.1.p3  ORF type:complete len:113 (-),score=4.45 GHVT01009704.1:2288-2626(-)